MRHAKAYARVRLLIRGSCRSLQAYCQSWIAEVQLRRAADHSWVNNTGTAAKSAAVASSGGYETMLAWKAVDGVYAFNENTEAGWDAQPKPLPGGAPTRSSDRSSKLSSSSGVAVDWAWDGVNGNNAVWTGSSAAGLRLFLKGAEPEWQAAVPFDSAQTPPIANLSWNNGGRGGITLYYNGTVKAYTGPITAAAGSGGKVELRFSVMATPVRPLDLAKHFKERYGQFRNTFLYFDLVSSVPSHILAPVTD